MNGEITTKPQTPSGITILAQINLVIYVLLFFWTLPSVYFLVSPVAIGIVLYSVAGIVCSWGLLQHKKWGWYMAMIMWLAEGVISSGAVYIGFSSPDASTAIIFLLIALFKFATAAYLATRKIRDSFRISKHFDAPAQNNTSTIRDQAQAGS